MSWLFIRFWGIQIPFIWNTIRLELTSVEWRKGESPEKYFHVMPRNGHRPITMSHINCLPLYQSPPFLRFFFFIFYISPGQWKRWRGQKWIRRSMRFHKCLSLCSSFFTHFVKWLDNPLFTGDDRPEEPNWTELELKLKEARKPFGHFGSGKISESILKFVSRLFLVIAANLADSQASGLVTEWVLHYLTNEATEVGN